MSREVLVFADEEALLVALTSELVPATAQSNPVSYARHESGKVFVRPKRKLSKSVVQRLRDAGVDTMAVKEAPKMAHTATTWPQLIAPRRATGDIFLAGQTVLFYIEVPASTETKDAASGGDGDGASDGPGESHERITHTLLSLAGELLRLGCDRVTYQLFGRGKRAPGNLRALLRAFEPPYYTVSAAGEQASGPGHHPGYRVFVPVRAGDTRTYIELGWDHPYARSLTPADGQIGLIAGDGIWTSAPDGPWIDVMDLVDITLPEPRRDMWSIRPQRQLAITLRLVSATRSDPPSLWVIHGGQDAQAEEAIGGRGARNAIDHVDSLVSGLPDDIISRLVFSVVTSEERGPEDPIVILRARHGRHGPPSIDVPGLSMVPLLGLGNVFIPHNATLEPPLRRDTVRDLLAPDADRVYWVTPTRDRRFRVESAPEHSFAPLADWIEYLVDRSSAELVPWVRSLTFEFESFQSIGTEWSAGPPPKKPRERPEIEPRPSRASGRRPTTEREADTDREVDHDWESEESAEIALELMRAQGEASGPGRQLPVRELSELEAELAALERAFLDADVAADAPERDEMWLSMARLLLLMGRHRDAALSFAHAIWERPRAEVAPLVIEWARAERAFVDIDEPARLLWHPVQATDAQGSSPDASLVRAVAVHWIASMIAGLDIEPLPEEAGQPMAMSRALHIVQSWLDAHDSALDVRTLWLLRRSLAERVGGDALTLARARDRILQSLQSGLSLERDVPTFLRFLGHQAGGNSVAAARTVEGLESLEGLLDRVPRKRHATEAPVHLTRSYVWLSIAYGFARLGQGERANELRDRARDGLAQELERGEPVHDYLFRAYSARMEQALQGLPAHAPLSAELEARLVALSDADATARYKIDQLRGASEILEPHQRVEVYKDYISRSSKDTDHRFLEELRGATGRELPERVERALMRIMSAEMEDEERARLLDKLMDHFPQMPSARAVPALATIVDAVATMPAEERAKLLQEALILAGHFGREAMATDIAHAIAELVTSLSTSQVESLAEPLGACLRGLGRLGLSEHVAQLVDALVIKLSGENVRELEDRLSALVEEDARTQSAEITAQILAAVKAFEARLHVAAGLASRGHEEHAAPILEAAQSVLEKTSFRVADHTLRLTRALAGALGACSQERALVGLDELGRVLTRVTDAKSTNSHFCLSVLAFVEALVLGYATSDLSLGVFGRRFLDEDEYLVRRRIHREIGATS